MKNIFILLIAFSISLSIRGDANVAFVDLKEVFRGFYKTQLAQDQIQQQADSVKLERDLMVEEIENFRKQIDQLRIDSRDEMLSEEARKNKRLQLEDQLILMQKSQKEMVEYEQLRSQQIEEQNNRMQNKLIDEIQNKIIEFAKEKNYDAIIDKSARSTTGTDSILFVNANSDVTALVLERLNKGYKKPIEKESVEDDSQ